MPIENEDIDYELMAVYDELREVLEVLYKACPEKHDYIKLNYPKAYEVFRKKYLN